MESAAGLGLTLASCPAQCLCGGAWLLFIFLWGPNPGHPEQQPWVGGQVGQEGRPWYLAESPKATGLSKAGVGGGVNPVAVAIWEEAGRVPSGSPASAPGA